MPAESPVPSFPRRTLVRGAAWTVPAVTVAAQAPAVSASVVPGCVDTYPFVAGSPASTYLTPANSATYTNTGAASVTFTFTQTAPYKPTGVAFLSGADSYW